MTHKELEHCHATMHNTGSMIGQILSNAVPPVPVEGAQGIPGEFVDDLAECFLIVIAEAIQSWIDAGSERDVTMGNDDLFNALRNELKSWSTRWEEAS